MDPSLPASEIIIAKVNDGSNIGQPGASSGDMAAFLDLLALVKGQDGVLRQYWVSESVPTRLANIKAHAV